MAAPSVAPEIREICAQVVERAGAAWALEESATLAACRRLWGFAEELQASLRGTELGAEAAELLVSLGASSESEARAGFARAGELLCELERRLARSTELPEASSSARSGRDNETVELIADFLAESLEGLDRVDEILLAAEQEPADSERVNALFRVFHTIKGVSAFLGANDVTGLAHVAETLLGQVREGALPLRGKTLELVFEASAAMRGLLGVVRAAVDKDLKIPEDPGLSRLVERLIQRSKEAALSAPPSAPEATDDEANAAPEARPGNPEAAASNGRIRETVKVDLERIDSVVEMIGELIIVESMIVHAPEISSSASLRLRNYLGQLTKISRDLQSVAMRMRMVPVRGVFQRMARLVRDLSAKTGKAVRFTQLGESTEMDRSMVERIEEPLVHMLRNAIDHAIEPREQRLAAGKPEVGVITIAAEHVGGSLEIELRDDGRGLSRSGILSKARERGLVGPDADSLSDAEVYALIFLPGFSTARVVSELSGRGVGMDIVKRTVEAMRGRVVIQSTLGSGTIFKLVLPLTLAIIDGMLIACGSERYIVPSLSIVESLELEPSAIRTLASSGELVDVRGEILPLQRLSRLFDVADAARRAERVRVVVVECGGRKLAIEVDDVVTQQQVVIKPLSEGVGKSDMLSGAAILSDGRVGLILNTDRIVELFGTHENGRRGYPEAAE